MATATKKKPAARAKATATNAKAKATAQKKAASKSTPVPASEAPKESFHDTVARGLKIFKPLMDAGIPVSMYSRGPSGSGVFILSKGSGIPGNILIWPGHPLVDITVNVDKSKKQAIIRVKEDARTLTHSGRWNSYQSSTRRTWDSKADSYHLRMAYPETAFPVSLPEGTKYSVSKQKQITYRGQNYLEATITAKVPASDQTFLVGIDETSVFVSLLSSHAETVDEAHELLRPKGVPVGSPRHGEFFFVPANKVELSRIGMVDTFLGARLETSSTHHAENVAYVDYSTTIRTFAKGRIYDSRTGHHSDLQLDEWHRVHRNTEQVIPARQRRWD